MSGLTKVVKTKLFIGNLDPATQSAELIDLFSPFGPVLEASVIKDYGFVHYGTVEEAEKAVAALNNHEFHGKRLRVELSTSTVRHRPGQPEPASALRNSRGRAGVIINSNGIPRYSPVTLMGGVGPMRHSASAWTRNDSRPYDGLSMDLTSVNPGYDSLSSGYDRPRPYDMRADASQYYSDRRDSGYGSGYDVSRDPMYSTPDFGGLSTGQTTMYSMRDYRDIPTHARVDGTNYGQNRMYERDQGTTPIDPYYSGAAPQEQPNAVDCYANYDSYRKYYPSCPQDTEFGASSSRHPTMREYDSYSNYHSTPYGAADNQAQLRHDVQISYQPSAAHYSQPNQQRLPQSYGNTTVTSYTSAHPQYYGAQQRA